MLDFLNLAEDIRRRNFAFIFPAFFGFGFILYCLPSVYCPRAQQEEHAANLSGELRVSAGRWLAGWLPWFGLNADG